MCRMIAAPLGLPGSLLIDPFLRMARGRNALNEHNTTLGVWTHDDGWGAVFQENGQTKARRSGEPCWKDPPIDDLRDRTAFLLHARRASKGSVTLENTHPFAEEIDESCWFFCHNGTVREDLPTAGTLAKADPTDSEKLFHLLLPFIARGDVLAGIREVYGGIRDFTSLNTFLLGPDELWVVCLYAKNPDYYTLTLTVTDAGPIVSSEPLDEHTGRQATLHNGTVLRIDRRTGAIETHALDCLSRRRTARDQQRARQNR